VSAIANDNSFQSLHTCRAGMRSKTRLRSLPIQTSTGAIYENAGKKFQGQKVTCITAHRSKKKETSVQRARRTATRHAIESQTSPVLKPQILQKTAGSLVSHCWTQENAAPNPKYPKN
jgi:hypothetical protein